MKCRAHLVADFDPHTWSTKRFSLMLLATSPQRVGNITATLRTRHSHRPEPASRAVADVNRPRRGAALAPRRPTRIAPRYGRAVRGRRALTPTRRRPWRGARDAPPSPSESRRVAVGNQARRGPEFRSAPATPTSNRTEEDRRPGFHQPPRVRSIPPRSSTPYRTRVPNKTANHSTRAIARRHRWRRRCLRVYEHASRPARPDGAESKNSLGSPRDPGRGCTTPSIESHDAVAPGFMLHRIQ